VAPIRTQLDAGEAGAALGAAWEQIFGEVPSEETRRILTAQWSHETGRGASMFNYNFGGIKGTGPTGLSVEQSTREGYGATEHRIVDRFRAYRTAEEGAVDYVKLLKNRFPEAIDAARQGDPVSFVQGLKARNYFTGDPAAYTRSIVSLSGLALPEGDTHSLPVLDAAPRLARAEAPYSTHASYSTFDTSLPLIDGMSLADEISRAALRIAAATRPKEERG
jgi:hypothetical protein